MNVSTLLPARLMPLLVTLTWMLGGCGGGVAKPRAEDLLEAARVAPVPVRAAPVNNGGIYRSHASLSLFSDLRAGRVGDILTVVLNEQTNASKSSTTSTRKSNSTAAESATILGIPVTSGGNPIFNNNLSTESEFDGEGGASISNQLEGSITVTVVQRLVNGNLVISGEKWLTLNQGEEYVRISGVVRPVDIEPDNSVPSEKVADAKIEYSGRGALADANQMNWLARFFNSPWLPF